MYVRGKKGGVAAGEQHCAGAKLARRFCHVWSLGARLRITLGPGSRVSELTSATKEVCVLSPSSRRCVGCSPKPGLVARAPPPLFLFYSANERGLETLQMQIRCHWLRGVAWQSDALSHAVSLLRWVCASLCKAVGWLKRAGWSILPCVRLELADGRAAQERVHALHLVYLDTHPLYL